METLLNKFGEQSEGPFTITRIWFTNHYEVAFAVIRLSVPPLPQRIFTSNWVLNFHDSDLVANPYEQVTK